MRRQRAVPSTSARLLTALLTLATLAWTPPQTSPPPPSPAVPDPIGEGLARLRAELEDILRTALGSWRASEWSVLAVSLDRGDTLFAENPWDVLAPASNMKLFTTAVAVQKLGPDFRYSTFLLADGSVTDGRLQGDLVLYGTGDPGISVRFHPRATSVFEEFADSLQAAGIHTIVGDVVGDGSYFTGGLIGEGWNPNDLNDAFAAPSSALAYNENVFQLRVRPTGESGGPPQILTLPEAAGVPIQNDARLGGSGRLVIRRTHPTLPIEVSGGIAPGSSEVWRRMTVQDPAHFAASVLRSVVEERGIRVMGGARSVYAADESSITAVRLWAPGRRQEVSPRVLARHTSAPLTEYLSVVNKRSHNLLADQVLKSLGRIVEGDGSYRGGAVAIARFLQDSVGVDASQVAILDGSGLSSLNRSSAAHFVALMDYMAREGDWATFWETLPEAGNPRELRRMSQSPAAGNLRAKTGTIQNVSALSGMVRTANGERIAFSIIANSVPSTNGAKGIEDRIGNRLAAFERPIQRSPATILAQEDATTNSTADGGARTSAIGSSVAADLPSVATARRGTPAPTDPVTTEDDLPGEELDGDEARSHEVRAGENFTVIARRYGISVGDLVEANPQFDPRRLMPGMSLTIP
jgi:D-alanyl-D-alanine carboxypeptidase/D-alanyl-D-alanine-endopeptidase (penicillin-binding protein 4)